MASYCSVLVLQVKGGFQALLLLTKGPFGFPIVDLFATFRVRALLGDDVE